jgi:glyoxylase-like metal-dependent hydrolase (beta-lactamase superfamily II)
MACLLIACLLLPSGPAFAHAGAAFAAQDAPAPAFRLEKLTERAYCLFGSGGNVGILVTEAGVLVVDDQYENVAPGIVDQIRALTDRPIRYLVNTHYHADHTGGNPVFVKFAEIIAHDNVRPRLLDYPETIRKTFPGRSKAIEAEIASLKDAADPYRLSLEKDLGLLKFFLEAAEGFRIEQAAPPGITYDGRLRLHLGGQEVEIFHVGPGHTDGDSLVFFRREKVLHMGDLFFNGMYPFIDSLGGGSSRGCIENIDRALQSVPPDTRVIPGHGPTTDVPTLRRYRDFLSDLRGEVERAVASGMSKPDAVRAIRMEAYPEIKPAFRTLGNNVAVIYDEIRPAR